MANQHHWNMILTQGRIDHFGRGVSSVEMAEYSQAMIHPVNDIRTVRLSLDIASGLEFCKSVLSLVKVLQHANNKVEELHLEGRKSYKIDPLLRALQHENCKVEVLILKRFLFDQERIDWLAQAIRDSNSVMRSLELREVSLPDATCVETLMSAIGDSRSMRSLVLVSNDIRRDDQAAALADSLSLSGLETLHLDFNLMDAAGNERILVAATQAPFLKNLSMNYCYKARVSGLPDLLHDLALKCTSLSIEGGPVTDLDLEWISAAIGTGRSHLEKLNLNHNEAITSQGVMRLCEAVMGSRNRLKQLHLGEVSIGNDGLLAIAHVIRQPGNRVEWLDIMNSSSSEESIDSKDDEDAALSAAGKAEQCFLDALASSSNRLQALYLSLKFPNESLNAMAMVLCRRNNALRSLGIHSTGKLSRDSTGYVRFAQAARRSRLRKAQFANAEHGLLSLDFTADWFQVLISLLAVSVVPRLGRSACCRMLAFQDLVIMIAETLGWPLSEAGRVRSGTKDECSKCD